MSEFNCSEDGYVRQQFEKVRLPVLLSITIVSLVFNICNIVIFSKRKMTSPTNSILLAIAVSDFCKVFIFCFITVVQLPNTSYSSQFVFLCCNVAMFLMHAFALWCGVLLALFRFFYLRFYASPRTKIWFGLCRARLAILLVLFANLLFMLPYVGILRITRQQNATSALVYQAGMRKEGQSQIRLLSAVTQKIVPCLIMTVLCVCIIHSLYQTEKRRESLANLNNRSCHSNCSAQPLKRQPAGKGRRERRSRDHRRTTSFLLIIMLLYILYEIPMSLLIVLSNPAFQLHRVNCFYNAFSSIFNTLGLVNNTINFILYCFMSKQFRDVFKEAFGLNKLAAKVAKAEQRPETEGTNEVLDMGRRHRNSNEERSGLSASEAPSNPCLEF